MSGDTARVALSWSGGKDAAWALHRLRSDPSVEVAGLVTTIVPRFGRVAMHGVRIGLVRAQAAAAGLPLDEVALEWPSSNEDYSRAMLAALARLRVRWGITHVAFGDLFLSDVRARIVCLDPARVPADLAGRVLDRDLLAALSPEVDPCGERGEFHTFVTDGPMLSRPVPVASGSVVEREGFVYADLVPAG